MNVTVTKPQSETKIESICARSIEIAEKHGEGKSESYGDKRDRTQVNGAIYQFKKDGLHISLHIIEFIDRVRGKAGNGIRKEASGELTIKYRGTKVLVTDVPSDLSEIRPSTYVKFPVWQRKLDEIYESLSNTN
jgi:hypothetical protein